MLHGLGEIVPGELDGELDADRTRAQSAASLRKISVAVPLVPSQAADSAPDERVTAKPPSGRSIGHVNAKPDVIGFTAGEGVVSRRADAVERDANDRHVLDAA